jgi:hypothetical protein
MKNIIAASAIALTVWSAAPRAQIAPGEAPAETGADNGLGDLATMTFSCPKAALNAAAREAAKVRSQGTYQFAFFKIVSDSHHAAYEVHFTSNYPKEKELKYCVAIYCQQGWDPRNTKTSVTLMNDTRKLPHEGHAASCGAQPASDKRTSKQP